MVFTKNKFQLKHGNKLAYLAFLVIVFTFGINFVFVRISNQELQPFWGAALRYFLASIVLWIVVVNRKIGLPDKKAAIGPVVYGLLSFAGNAGLLYWALKYAPPATASIICATSPIITLFISNIVRLEKITKRGIFSGILVVLGVYLIFKSELKNNIPILAILSILAATTFASLSTVVLKYCPQVNPVLTNAIGMTAGAQGLFIISLYAKESIEFPTSTMTWLSLIWLIASSSTAFILMVWLISKWSVSKVSYVTVLSPLITSAASVLVLKNSLSASFITGSIIVLGGTIIYLLSGAKPFVLTFAKVIKYNIKT